MSQEDVEIVLERTAAFNRGRALTRPQILRPTPR